jgi:hypothetical protein
MAIDITRASGSNSDGTYKLHFFYPVASLKVYKRCWEKAIIETDVKLFKEYSKFGVKDLEQVIGELNRLLIWARVNLSDVDIWDMTYRLENLLEVIPEACKDPDAVDCPFEIY